MSWVTENPIHPSTFTPGSPAVPILGLDLRPPLFQLPGPSAMVSASLLSLMAQIKSTFCSTIWENPRLPPSSPAPESHPGEGGGLQPGPIATFWAAASIPALLRPFPQTDSLPFAFSLTSPPWSPPHSRPPPFPVYSKPGLLHHPPPPFSIQGPQVPGAPPPLPLVLLPWVSPPLAPPILPAPGPPITTSPHEASPVSTSPYLACRAPAPPCRAPPGAGGGRRRDRERPGEPNWALPQRQPRLRVRPQTRPRPQTHPSTPSKDRAGTAAQRCTSRLGWRAQDLRSGQGSLRGRSWSAGVPLPSFRVSDPSRPEPPSPAGRCWVGSPKP